MPPKAFYPMPANLEIANLGIEELKEGTDPNS
jgi:hypothetical protein